jgi:hypothetical protein
VACVLARTDRWFILRNGFNKARFSTEHSPTCEKCGRTERGKRVVCSKAARAVKLGLQVTRKPGLLGDANIDSSRISSAPVIPWSWEDNAGTDTQLYFKPVFLNRGIRTFCLRGPQNE